MKKSEEVLAEIHRNCQLALSSITDILPETEDTRLREELLRQHEEYEKLCARAALLAKDKDIELKNPGPIKKAYDDGQLPRAHCGNDGTGHRYGHYRPEKYVGRNVRRVCGRGHRQPCAGTSHRGRAL